MATSDTRESETITHDDVAEVSGADLLGSAHETPAPAIGPVGRVPDPGPAVSEPPTGWYETIACVSGIVARITGQDFVDDATLVELQRRMLSAAGQGSVPQEFEGDPNA